jgi:hypothetical protein
MFLWEFEFIIVWLQLARSELQLSQLARSELQLSQLARSELQLSKFGTWAAAVPKL